MHRNSQQLKNPEAGMGKDGGIGSDEGSGQAFAPRGHVRWLSLSSHAAPCDRVKRVEELRKI
jgi:hypothetical protein